MRKKYCEPELNRVMYLSADILSVNLLSDPNLVPDEDGDKYPTDWE